jgi:NADH dehydrogenase
VTAIDAAARTLDVRAPDGSQREVPYDSLIVAGGMVTSYFGKPELARSAHGMKSIDDALYLRDRIFGAFEMAEWVEDADQRSAWLTFAIVGAGPTGVELAGQIGELAHRSLAREFRRFDPAQVRILLFDAGPRILPTFPARLSRRAAAVLARLGVEITLETSVADVDERSITVVGPGGERRTLAAMTTIWAAGVHAAPIARVVAEATGASTDRLGRIAVAADCSLPSHPEIFVVGDMMDLDNLPGVAEVAMQSGRHAAGVIAARLKGDARPRPFHYHDRGTMAAVSRTSAVAAWHGRGVSGRLGWLAWLLVHLAFLTGFKNRFTTLVHWTIAFVGRGREERAITSLSKV